MGELNPAIDFLDVLSDDIPKGEATELGLPYTETCHIQPVLTRAFYLMMPEI